MRIGAAGAAIGAILLAACTASPDAGEPTPTAAGASTAAPATSGASVPEPTATPTPAPAPTASTAAPTVTGDCPPADPDAVAWSDGPTATMTALTTPGAAAGDVEVRAAVYPGPAETGAPWSQWGQGAVTADGRFLSAVGDHRGVDGNSYVYEYDPASGELTLVADVLALVDHRPGAWGYGKIHAPLVVGPCDQVYTSTYWGTRRDLRYGNGYDGDVLLRLDPANRTTSALGVPVPRHGTPSMNGDAARGLLYGEATDPVSDPDGGSFFVYDVATGETTVVDDSAEHIGFRSLAVDTAGRALFTMPAGRLTRYDPATGDLTMLPDPLPGRFVRAVTPAAPDGTIYGVTQDPPAFFAVGADGSIEDLGPAPGYVTSLAMEPDGSRIYFVPGAHGDAWQDGTPVLVLDPATGRQNRLVELNPLTEGELGLTAGGSYNVVLDAARRRLFVGLNAAPTADREDTTFGAVVLVEITLPGDPAAEVAAGGDGGETAAADVEALTCWTAPPPIVGSGPAPAWQDVTSRSGLESPLTGMMGHAAAWGDVDGDGAADLVVGTFADRPPDDYAARGATGPSPDRLLRGDGQGAWRDVAAPFQPGRTSATVFADLDLDDDVDLVMARNAVDWATTPTEIWRNDDGELRRLAPGEAGLDPSSPGRSIGVLHLDDDELPDLVILEDRFRGGSSRLYRNLGGLRFEPVDDPGWPADVHGLGVGTGDLDGDGYTDVVVGGSNRVFAGTGRGLREVPGVIAPWPTFGDEDDPAGVALGDVDGDGDLDVVIGQHYNSTLDDGGATGQAVPVRLYLNDSRPGAIALRDATAAAGLAGIETKAPHVALVDLDNDGWLDLLTTASADGGSTPVVFVNAGATGETGPRFSGPGATSGEHYWVTGPTADVDRDGRVDVLLVEWDPARPTRLLRNESVAGHFLDVSVDASLGGGPGTVVAAYEPGRAGDADALVGRHEISVSQGYGGGIEPTAHIGLGDRGSVDLVVTPPGGRDALTLLAVPADRHVRLPAGCGPAQTGLGSGSRP